jgi:quinol monooxygenase YgiN
VGGILRLVRFAAAPGVPAELRDGVPADVMPRNTRFGCVSCRVPEERGRPGEPAVAGVWRSAEDLDAVSAAPEHRALAAAVRRRSAGGPRETLFRALA